MEKRDDFKLQRLRVERAREEGGGPSAQPRPSSQFEIDFTPRSVRDVIFLFSILLVSAKKLLWFLGFSVLCALRSIHSYSLESSM
jgi:hypothetical protein